MSYREVILGAGEKGLYGRWGENAGLLYGEQVQNNACW
jgi:hypothetical protein